MVAFLTSVFSLIIGIPLNYLFEILKSPVISVVDEIKDIGRKMSTNIQSIQSSIRILNHSQSNNNNNRKSFGFIKDFTFIENIPRRNIAPYILNQRSDLVSTSILFSRNEWNQSWIEKRKKLNPEDIVKTLENLGNKSLYENNEGINRILKHVLEDLTLQTGIYSHCALNVYRYLQIWNFVLPITESHLMEEG